MNVNSRLWHWTTTSAQQHIVFEQFLTQNELLTDRFVESSLGNDLNLNFKKIGVNEANLEHFPLDQAGDKIKNYRNFIFENKNEITKNSEAVSDELISILDDVTELCSKTLYLLKLK